MSAATKTQIYGDEWMFEPIELKDFAKQALKRGFHIFPLQPKKKEPLVGSSGFKDAKHDAGPWNEAPDANIGIATGESDLCVLDFDKPESIPG